MSIVTNAIVIEDRTGQLALDLDPQTGLPIALNATLHGEHRDRFDLRWAATLVTEGREIEGQPFGLAYADTVNLSDFSLVSSTPRRDYVGDDEIVTISTRTGNWLVDWEYRFRLGHPRLEVQLVLSPVEGIGTIRNVHLDIAFSPTNPETWNLHAPGAGIRPAIPLPELSTRTTFGAVSAMVSGSDPNSDAPPRIPFTESAFSGTGILILDQPEEEISLLIWPFSRTEHTVNNVTLIDESLQVQIQTYLGGRIEAGERLRWGSVELDAFPHDWAVVRSTANSWFGTLGISKPVDTAAWIPGTSIFEVQIGKSVFWNGYEYSPYPTMRDLYNDLGRIAGLGFEVIQIMPRQPFPSYNVYDYFDITLSYGDEEDLKAVVKQAHALGMKVILDILMHGVIDAEIIHRAADRVRNGPYFARLDEGTEVVANDDYTAYQGQDYLVSWARHIIDFEEHWAGGSPGSHPLIEEHPEWFIRDSAGEIIGVYTKAFDVSNPAWQEYFTEATLNLMLTLGIDGFRVDAPTYNEFPNWSQATEKRASRQQLGAVEYFGRLRTAIKYLKPDALLYTEPSGSLFRQTMDITYNYDEHWLFHAILRPQFALQKNPLGVRHGHDLAAWFQDKEAVLPTGAITARHVDSHDTFWWPLPGFKWRREQYGLPATKALIATWSLVGGAYMTFVGGEEGVEDLLRRVNRLRRELPEIRHGQSIYDQVEVSDARIFGMARVHEANTSILLVNFSAEPITAGIWLHIALTYQSEPATVTDTWNDVALTGPDGYVWEIDQLENMKISFEPWQARLLTLRAAHQ